MGLETATYISGLNASNPTSGDSKLQGDDHLRLLKSTILASFPGITGAVTATHTELNLLDGVTATTAEINQLDGNAFSGNMSTTGRFTAVVDGQTGYATAGVESRSSTGDVYIALHAGGSSAAALKHARGGNGISVVDTSGNPAPISVSTIAASAQPSFRATNSATTTSSTTTLGTWTETYDQASNFNNSTGTFVAPVAGVYLLVLDWQCSLSSAGQVEVQIYNSTAGVTLAYGEFSLGSAAGIIKQGAVVALARLTVSDSVVVRSGTITNGTLYGNSFSGHLLG